MRLIIKRLEATPVSTRGVLFIDDRLFCLTLELPWRENRPNISCIPTGQYKIKRIHSPKFGNTFEIIDVPGRSEILLHAGNSSRDTRGCVLLGHWYSYLNILPAVMDSRKAFDEFLERVKDADSADLDIVDLSFSSCRCK